MATNGSAGASGSSARPSSSNHQQNRNHSSQRGSGPKHVQRGRGGRGRGNPGGKKRDMGRSEWSKQKPDKRSANDEAQAIKKQKLNDGDGSLPIYATQFNQEELDAEARRPKKKVAVLIGYSGTGYKGMQLAPDQKTIEGDLFKAFVEAGAISKANADDPRKSSFVRCARTDKGVHAAGNVISLKMIVEDEDIVQRINDALTPQIRVWGFERTNGSFSAYQLCDSRIYEYLIPTHSLLPPHPKTFMGKKCLEWAERKSEVAEWKERQAEVEGYWEKIDEEMIQPILNEYPEDIRNVLEKALWMNAEQEANKQADTEGKPLEQSQPVQTANTAASDATDLPKTQQSSTQAVAETEDDPDGGVKVDVDAPETISTNGHVENDPETEGGANFSATDIPQGNPTTTGPLSHLTKEERIARRKTIDEAVKRLRAAYVSAKRSYRIHPDRLTRLQKVLTLYLGTNNFWNYTIAKKHNDPSAKRVIKSFTVNPTPILIDGTEWLSLKVHGQSFMMHQIRKMVGMASLLVRCGCDPTPRIRDSYGPNNMSIPKAPALGLLLERPVFDSYNKRATSELNKDPVTFDPYKSEMDTFKQKFIYERMYEDEERENVFGNFFNHVDNFPSNTFLFVTSGGLEASGEADGVETGRVEGQLNRFEKTGNVDGDEDESDGDIGGVIVDAPRKQDIDSEDEDGGINLDNNGNEG